ncbi:protoporphyrinogen/coproporphyrinogen oxidase [Serinibacter salmoneus]|uniref:Oxygen-dependent protoporphyrinogen oxidase n=1 Tax=Serinibacter salmoneus TaxID=556530 RepID=A0A2A9CZ36_9MICO|nr:FAD-dependent oxidoreductase [Serinibacter salmoneus]PFG19694.1 oxygen-dependent protoporphyrinogen oxidase [Serinibacter salmoneus]
MTDPVIVVGGGIAGLTLAADVAAAGREVTVLERAERLGGQVEGATLAGHAIDLGAEAFATRGGVLAGLAADLGLDVETPATGPAWVVGPHGAYPLPAAGVLGIPTHPLAPEVRHAIGTPAALRAWADRVLPIRAGGEGTLGEVVRRRMGRRVLERLVDPVVRGVFSSSAENLPVATASPALARELTSGASLAAAAQRVRAASPAGSQVARVTGGMSTLVTALQSRLTAAGGLIRTGAEVTTVRPDGVELAGGEHLSGRVVLAAADLVAPSRTTRRIAVVALAVRCPALDAAPRGTGALVARDTPGITARALTHTSAKWSSGAGDGVHLVRLSYDEAPAQATPAADLAAITGVPDGGIEILDVARRTWVRTIAVEGTALESAIPGIPTIGEASGRTGLAAIVSHAREVAAHLSDEIRLPGPENPMQSEER